MTRNTKLLFYVLVIFIFGALSYWIADRGSLLESSRHVSTSPNSGNAGAYEIFQDAFLKNLFHPLSILLLQVTTIILISRIFGFLFHRISQPTVIGEIVAGIVLGPSVVGLLFPEFSGFLFPDGSIGNLQFLSQVGLILFMFFIGLELDWRVVRNQARDAVVISHASIVFPFFLGMGLAYVLYSDFAPVEISFLSFALFMGIAMSITAFPVLARVIQERDLTKTNLGMMAITCAAADDITAWCLLAIVIAIVKAGSFVSALYSIGLAIGFVLLMTLIVQPFLQRLGRVYSSRETISKTIVAVSFLVLLLSAYVAEVIGIHALFGAFLAGVIMPSNFNFRRTLMEKVEDVSVVLLLPLFFVFTGLRTEIGLLDNVNLWMVCAAIVLTAVAGKFGGTTLAAKFMGQSWKESLSLGALMNTRGLMELIVLNIGYDLGVLSAEIFAMLVLMALVTTLMTGPALDVINHFLPEKKASDIQKFYKILIAFGPPDKGRKLLRLAEQLTRTRSSEVRITALHLTPSSDINPAEARTYEDQSFALVKSEADRLGIKVRTRYRAVNDINREISRETKEGSYDLLLVGASQSLFGDDVMGGKVRTFMAESGCHVGVLVDRDFEDAKRVLVLPQTYNDLFLISFAERLIAGNSADVVIADPHRLIGTNVTFSMAIDKINKENPGRVNVRQAVADRDITDDAFDLVLISSTGWRDNFRSKQWLQSFPSVLILKPEGKR